MTDSDRLTQTLLALGITVVRRDGEPGWPRHIPSDVDDTIPADAFSITVGQTAFWFTSDERYLGYVTDDTFAWTARK